MAFPHPLRGHSARLPIGLATAVAATLAFVSGCSSDKDVIRGRGLHPAKLSATATARVYEAALHGAFDLSNPALVLLLHPRILPRTAKIDAGDSVPAAVVSTLRSDGVIRGRCDPRPVPDQKTPRCTGVSMPGYVVRFTDVLQLRPDTVEVFLTVVSFSTPDYPRQELRQFENIYQVVKTADGWTAIREGRVPK